MDYTILPHVNAILNTTSALLLMAGGYFIWRRRVRAHLTCMIAALSTSLLFLASYVTYHVAKEGVVTRFTEEDAFVRGFYFTVLTTHTILAVVIVPLVAVTVWRAARGQLGRHKRIARWTLPLWLYVSVTGVVVYAMLYHLYPPR